MGHFRHKYHMFFCYVQSTPFVLQTEVKVFILLQVLGALSTLLTLVHIFHPIHLQPLYSLLHSLDNLS
jgi:hypothetical protein